MATRGRPRKDDQIDVEQMERLAAIWATDEEMAAVFGVCQDTIQRIKKIEPWKSAYARGRSTGKISVRRAQMECAMKGNPTMLIWLGKQLLGQREQVEAHLMGAQGPITIGSPERPDLKNLTTEEIRQMRVLVAKASPNRKGEQETVQ